MTREDILTSIGVMKSELYVLGEEAEQIEKEIKSQRTMGINNAIQSILATSALCHRERELRLHDLVIFYNTGRYPE